MKNAVITVDYQMEKIILKDIKNHTHLEDEFFACGTATGEFAVRSSHVLDLTIEDEEE